MLKKDSETDRPLPEQDSGKDMKRPQEDQDTTTKPAQPSTDPEEARLISLFCQGPALQTCLASFCKDTRNSMDPLLQVLLIALNAPVQIQLTRVGLQLFQVRRAEPARQTRPPDPASRRARTSRSRTTGWTSRSVTSCLS